MDLIVVLIILVLGVTVLWLFKPKINNNDNKFYENELERLRGEISVYQSEIKENRENITSLSAELSQKVTQNEFLSTKLEEQKQELDKLQQRFMVEFENLANRIFENKSQKFTEQNKQNLEIILNPLKENIKEFKQKVEDSYEKENNARVGLQTEIKRLYELNQHMTKEAQELTRALKGDSKSQGNWGEYILETVLEKSGLVRDREFVMQESLIDSEGNRKQPDVIINLPEKKHMIIDSKVSLNAYEKYCNAESDEIRMQALKAHVGSIKNHIKELSSKNYPLLYKVNTPDFVLMFVPIEPAFALAVQSEQELFYEAFEKNIILVSPSNLLATLRTVASIWRNEKQNKNAQEIAEQSGRLYDKFVGFIEDMEKIGNQLRLTGKSYEDAMGKLKDGRGNLIGSVEKIKKLGAKTTKQLEIDEEILQVE